MSMAGSGVLLAGATGLIGSLAMPTLLQRAGREDWQIYAPARRALKASDPRLHVILTDPNSAAGLAIVEQALDAAGVRLGSFVCALGTTLRAAGSQAAFAAIDRDLVVALAAIARRLGARQALIVSSVGAAPDSSSFYLRVKGEMESAVAALGFQRVDLLQPSLLLGDRASERRSGERVAQILAPLFNPLLQGPMRRYRAIEAATVAGALVNLVQQPGTGVRRLTTAAIVAAAAGS
jgi:uncharacterized protein YbjT (DUF2867 family)